MNGAQIKFTSVFIAVVFGTALVVAAMLVNVRRPFAERTQPSATLARATGKCADCHRRETSAIIHEFERSQHAAKGINCMDCHHAVEGQTAMDHAAFPSPRR
jgi:hydroxylamine dehydrogenase